jgi:hypothetical protein
MPEGDTYDLIECPPGTPFKAHGATADGVDEKFIHPAFHIGASYSLPKILIGLFQAVWAVVTLYKVRGDQLDLYGYAAFGLTVAPYAFMSWSRPSTPPCSSCTRPTWMRRARQAASCGSSGLQAR